ncbi:transmembrane protein 161B-like [Haliotis rubra]|uniref:transmembrane protein 161B-like n=1 Tax=Haliotis rubra TaxID=36100 RepID=UPI001EE5255B|nr:transmembrane protein 161B-like [Haliotis rubra]XP_046565398.1 transmembrane protein 161B-like [Haliotis rubra]XP_046565399.1 transmembrane protein 161B-like [Haliotis rubra]
MAVLGVQFVFSLVMFSFLQKLSPYYSFARWLMCRRLVRYLHPTDEDLRTQAGIAPPGKGKGRRNDKKEKSNNTTETFMVPRNIDIQLEMTRVEPVDLVPLHFYPEFQWLLDFSVCACIVYILTEIYYALSMHHIEFNASILWCLLAIGFCLRTLLSQTALYFRTEEGGERILCITFGFFYLVLGMGVLVVGDDILEFGLEEGYRNFSGNAEQFLKQQGVESTGPVSLLTFKIVLAITCSILGAFLTFPGLRLAKLHSDAMKYARENYVRQTLLHFNYALPLLIVLSYIKPIARNVFCGHLWTSTGALIPDDSFDNIRLLLVVGMFVARLALFSTFMQSHLNLAHLKLQLMKREAGKISNVDLQKMITRVFYYLCVVALQYITPVILILFMSFLLKTLGDYSWTTVLGEKVTTLWSQKNQGNRLMVASTKVNETDSILDTAAHFTYTIGNLRTIFTPVWYRGLLSFLMWWMCTVWFTSTSLGMLYYSQSETMTS